MNKQLVFIKIIVLTGLLLLTKIGFSQDQNFHIYLCFGQSNMEGSALIEKQDSTVDHRFQMMPSTDCPELARKKGAWYPAVPPLSQCG